MDLGKVSKTRLAGTNTTYNFKRRRCMKHWQDNKIYHLEIEKTVPVRSRQGSQDFNVSTRGCLSMPLESHSWDVLLSSCDRVRKTSTYPRVVASQCLWNPIPGMFCCLVVTMLGAKFQHWQPQKSLAGYVGYGLGQKSPSGTSRRLQDFDNCRGLFVPARIRRASCFVGPTFLSAGCV